jgi:hypothetical protein
VPFVALLLSLPFSAAHAVGPSLEFGPEAEARFIERCTDMPGAAPGACRCLSEGLQRFLGYPAFLEIADGGPSAFARSAEARLASALRRAEAGCLGQATVRMPAAR